MESGTARRLFEQQEAIDAQRSRRRETARLYLALRKLAVPKDLLIYSRDAFERFKDSAHHIVGTPGAKAGCCMSAPEHARNLLAMARKDVDALHGMIGKPRHH